MKTMAILIITVAATLGAAAEEAAETALPGGPAVEVAFVLDTTGSMSGLIQAAKEKIWAIANTVALADPTPDIKLGLVGYRDRGDEYITKVMDLTVDLDAVYAELMQFNAGGGGDTPESVNQAVHEAVTKLSWSTDDDTYRVIFLVGDAPPHMDYEQDVLYEDTCKKAAGAAIYINTIQCGGIDGTERFWRDIAAKAEGRYFRVEQSGGAILAETPFDEELGELSDELDATRVYFGSAAEQAEMMGRARESARVMAAAPAPAKASRAAFNVKDSGARNFAGKKELVSQLAAGEVTLDDIGAEEMPDEMKGMSSKERKAYLEKKTKEREKLQKQIEKLSEKRQAYLKKQAGDKALDSENALDACLYECIKTQGAKRGLTYKGDAPEL